MRLIKSILIFFSCFILLHSCAALKKRTHEPEVAETAGVTPAVESALKTPDFTEGEWPAYNWWTVFEDEQLSLMMEIAIEKNPDLLAAVSRVRSSEEEAQMVRSVLMPQLSAGFNDNYEHLSKDSLDRFPPSKVPAVVNQVYLALNFEYEIDLFGKNRNRYRAAIGKARSQAAEMSQSLLMITAMMGETYFNYAANLMNLQLSEDLAAAKKNYLELIRLRKENGIDDQIDVDQAAASLLSAEEQVVVYAKEVEINESQLKILMGLGPDDKQEFKTPTIVFNRPFSLPDNIPLNLLSRRPDLMAQIWNVEAAAYLISASKAAFFPNINLTAFAGLESLRWNNFFTHDSLAGAVSPAINLPLFTGGKLTAHLKESYANYDTAVYDYNSLLLRAAKEVSDQIKTLEATSKNSRLQSEALEKVLNVSNLTLLRYENGVDNYLTVLQRQVDTLKEGIKEVEIQNERYMAVLQLIKALGGGYGRHAKQP